MWNARFSKPGGSKMNEYINNFTEMLGPAASGKLGHALIGLLILIVGLFVVKIVAGIITRMLKKVEVLHRTNTDGSVTDLASPIASLIKAILTIFILMLVLEHFGLTDVLAPLKGLMTEITGALPNIIGAGIIMYAGWIIAKIVSQLVTAALGKFDEKLAAKTGNNDIKVSAFGGAVVLIAILLPIIVSALGVLNIPAISVPASAMIEKLMAAVPNIIGAGIILLVAYLVTSHQPAWYRCNFNDFCQGNRVRGRYSHRQYYSLCGLFPEQPGALKAHGKYQRRNRKHSSFRDIGTGTGNGA
jgi:hypothetical protein